MLGVALLFLLFGVLFTVVLYVLIAEEPASTTVTDRTDAERDARQFGGIESRKHGPSVEENDVDTDGSRRKTDTWGYSRLDDERES